MSKKTKKKASKKVSKKTKVATEAVKTLRPGRPLSVTLYSQILDKVEALTAGAQLVLPIEGKDNLADTDKHAMRVRAGLRSTARRRGSPFKLKVGRSADLKNLVIEKVAVAK